MTREHIDKRRLTHITTTDKGHIAQIIFGDLRNLLGTTLKFGFGYLHNQYFVRVVAHAVAFVNRVQK
jgi:hypothetical protein